jgi:hypothetical protein
VAGDGHTELPPEDVDDDALLGPVVQQVDQIPEDQKDLTTIRHLGQRVEGTMDVRDEEQLQV